MCWKKSRPLKFISGLPLCFSLLFASSSSFAIDDSAAGSTYKTLDYRMVFTELAVDQDGEGTKAVLPLVVDAKIKAMYEQLFKSSDANKQIVFNATGNPTGLKFVKDIGSNDIRSEGMSYGMMVAVMMDDQATFNALWGFARTYMYRPSNGDWYGWSLQDASGYPVNDSVGGKDPAADGEEYFAMALFFADHRWGSTTGANDITNYSKWANDTLRILKNTTGKTMWNAANNMVKFSPGEEFTDPSYHVPAFYELWGQWASSNPDQWHTAAAKSRAFLKLAVDGSTTNSSGRKTGLFSEYASYAGVPQDTTYNDLSQQSAYDAYRVIQNIAVDHYWWSKNTDMKNLVEGVMNFYYSDRELTTPTTGRAKFYYKGIYGLSNDSMLYITPPARNQTAPVPGLAAMNAVGAVASDQPYAKDFVQYLWDLPTPTGGGRYYDGMLEMLAYLHLSGYYRIYAANEGASLDLSMATSRQDANGDPLFYYGAPAYFTVAGCPQGQTEGAFSWKMDFLEDRADIPASPDWPSILNQTFTKLSNGRYLGQIPIVAPSHGAYKITATRKCNGVDLVESSIGYVDPSGYVRTITGYPVSGATVTLFQTATNDSTSLLSQLPNGSAQMAPYNRKNPDLTDASGHFGWDVTYGHWYKVSASHPACFSPTDPLQQIVSTSLMFVPPAVTNLDIVLACPGPQMATTVSIYNDWGTGYCADVIVRNNNSVPVNWKVKFNVEGKVDNFWGANLVQTGSSIAASGLSGNTILPGYTTAPSLGFCATRKLPLTNYNITVRARGTSGAENINLTVGGVVVASWNLTTGFKDYTVSTQLGGGINVVYTNDNGVANRDVVVDFLDIANVRYQTEDQLQNTSVYGNGRCGGGSRSEWMHCSGWVGFPAAK